MNNFINNKEIIKGSNIYYKEGKILVVGDYLNWYNKHENCLEEMCPLKFVNLTLLSIDSFGLYLEGNENLLSDPTWNVYILSDPTWNVKQYEVYYKTLQKFITDNETIIERFYNNITALEKDIIDGVEDNAQDIDIFIQSKITPVIQCLTNIVKDGFYIMNKEEPLSVSQTELKEIIIRYDKLKQLIITKFG